MLHANASPRKLKPYELNNYCVELGYALIHRGELGADNLGPWLRLAAPRKQTKHVTKATRQSMRLLVWKRMEHTYSSSVLASTNARAAFSPSRRTMSTNVCDVEPSSWRSVLSLRWIVDGGGMTG